jgi:transposase InsO family protein
LIFHGDRVLTAKSSVLCNKVIPIHKKYVFSKKYKYSTREEARNSIFEYIGSFYNSQRLHNSIGYLSTMQFEMAA